MVDEFLSTVPNLYLDMCMISTSKKYHISADFKLFALLSAVVEASQTFIKLNGQHY